MALIGASCLNKCLVVNDLSHVGQLRRAVELEASRFDPVQRGRAAIVATEIATNIVRYTQGGEALFRLVSLPTGLVLEILGVDRGPGMSDPDRCMKDGYSTRGTAGNGLGAVQRQSEEFDLHSTPEQGTVILARIPQKLNPKSSVAPLQFGGVCTAYPGEPVCGDAWRVHWKDDGYAVMTADGLGHGVLASEAAEAAADVFDANPFLPPAQLVELIHRHMHGTRGGTVAVASYDSRREQLSYSGIGNISGRLLSGAGSRGLISVNGTAGVNVAKIQQFDYDCAAGTTLVMHSDGLQSRWDVNSYAGLLARHPGVLAGALYRDHQRGRDDVSVVAARWTGGSGARGGA